MRSLDPAAFFFSSRPIPALAYAATRLLERHVFDYDPRYFAWAFLALTILFSVGLWAAFARA